jgi:hypothetical protein
MVDLGMDFQDQKHFSSTAQALFQDSVACASTLIKIIVQHHYMDRV